MGNVNMCICTMFCMYHHGLEHRRQSVKHMANLSLLKSAGQLDISYTCTLLQVCVVGVYKSLRFLELNVNNVFCSQQKASSLVEICLGFMVPVRNV